LNKTKVRAQLEEIGIIPCARVKVPEHAFFAAETLHAAGIPNLEIPLTLPEAPDVIQSLVNRFPDMVVGAGTVLTEQAAKRSIEAGARFLTSPGFVPSVVACAREADVVVFPGACTPTEVITVWQAGADYVKVFPAAVIGGSKYVRALKVPLPDIPLIVTGGINQLTAFDYILAGATAIGVGGELLPKDALAKRHEERIRELARRFLIMVKEARQQRISDPQSGVEPGAELSGLPRFSGS
jgi:2-dehydro-3-deoxyphosphogluconate aldolase / (4S)-4-hydroxy-2-oxoglutarate aldolase